MADKNTILMAQFYEKCAENGYTCMTDATQSLKAKVIAADLNLNYGNIEKFYAKAKQCYEQVQAEKNEEQRKAEIQQKAQEEEAARRAVNGDLLLSIRGEISEHEVDVEVFMRPDHSIYSVVNKGGKIEGAPTIRVLKGSLLTTTYHPSKAIYTSATVGGITTGGIHHTQASYSEKVSSTDKGSIEIYVSDTRIQVKRFTASALIKEKFKRDEGFLSYAKSGGASCYQRSELGDSLRQSAMQFGLSYEEKMNRLSMAANEYKLPYSTCEGIANVLGRIVNAQFPPSDNELYTTAKMLAAKSTSAEVKRAAETFASISDYHDAAQCAKEAEAKYENLLQAEKEQAILKKEAAAKTQKKIAAIAAPLLVVAVIAVAAFAKFVMPDITYEKAMKLEEAGNSAEAGLLFGTLGDYKDSKMHAFSNWDKAGIRETVSAGDYHTVGVKTGGTVVAVGSNYSNQIKVNGWTDIIAVFAGEKQTLGLKEDGTIVFTGDDSSIYDEFRDVLDWTDIIAVSSGRWHTVGLKANGTIAVAGSHYGCACFRYGWWNLIDIAAGEDYTVGLKKNGKVKFDGNDEYGNSEVSTWRNIRSLDTGYRHTVGLKADGTVVAVGDNKDGQCDVSDWSDIVSVSAGGRYTVGLRADGTVVVAGDIDYSSREASEWTDIVAINAGNMHMVGLKADGTVVAAGNSKDGQCDVERWSNIRIPNN